MERDCKGPHPVTAKVDREMKQSLDQDASLFDDFRADRVRDALTLYMAVRRGEFYCTNCGEPIEFKPES